MPEMGGVETTRRIREREASEGGHIPIVAMTAHALIGDREQFVEADMDDYIYKPISQDRLREVVRTAGQRSVNSADSQGGDSQPLVRAACEANPASGAFRPQKGIEVTMRSISRGRASRF